MLYSFGYNKQADQAIFAKNGILDLKHSPFGKNIIRLDGQWRFYWNELLNPKDILKGNDNKTQHFLQVPGFWAGHELNGKKLPVSGHATYFLSVTHLPADIYGLIIPTTYMPTEIWLNEKQYIQTGTVADNEKQTTGKWLAHHLVFNHPGGNLNITIKLASYTHKNFENGIARSLQLGKADIIYDHLLQECLIGWLSITCLFLVIFYLLIIFYFRRTDKMPLYLAGFFLLLILGGLFTRNVFLLNPVLDLSITNTLRIAYISQSFLAIAYLYYLSSIIKHEVNNHILHLFRNISILYFIAMWLMVPNEPYSSRTIYSIVMAIIIMYANYCALLAVLRKRHDSLVLYTGCLLSGIAMLQEILLCNDLIKPTASNSDGHAAIGITIFLFCQMHILARRHARANHEAQISQQLKEEKKAADLASEEKNRFFAAASHDLRQPLYALGLYANMLNKKKLSTEAKHLATCIFSSTSILRNMVDSLLDVSQMDSKSMSVNLSTFPIQNLLTQLKSDYDIHAKEKKLKFRCRDCRAIVSSDQQLLNRVLSNLLSNAIKFTQKGKVLLGCRYRHQQLEIQVWDTGCGIPQHAHQAIFDEFYQLNNIERDRNKGLGLGLSIVKRLSQLLNHPIRVFSNINKGTMISIKIPLISKEYFSTQELSNYEYHDLFITILIIEDDKLVRNALAQQLNEWGVDVLTAKSLQEAKHHMDQQTTEVDLIITDYQISNITGIEILLSLQSQYDMDIPALLITGDTSGKAKQAATENNIPILYKPLDTQSLYKAILKYHKPLTI